MVNGRLVQTASLRPDHDPALQPHSSCTVLYHSLTTCLPQPLINRNPDFTTYDGNDGEISITVCGPRVTAKFPSVRFTMVGVALHPNKPPKQ